MRRRSTSAATTLLLMTLAASSGSDDEGWATTPEVREVGGEDPWEDLPAAS